MVLVDEYCAGERGEVAERVVSAEIDRAHCEVEVVEACSCGSVVRGDRTSHKEGRGV